MWLALVSISLLVPSPPQVSISLLVPSPPQSRTRAAVAVSDDISNIGSTFRYREGGLADALPIASTLLSMKMNPLGVEPSRFIVCETSEGERIGFGQIRLLSDGLDKGGSPFFPGLASAPWSDEFKSRDGLARLFAERITQTETEPRPLWELASIFVEETWRSRGIGRSIVRRLLERHEANGRLLEDTYLLTLEPTVGWYEQLGFRRADAAPDVMAFEVAAGEALSAVLGNRLVCMRGNS